MGTLRDLNSNPRLTKYLIEKRMFEKDPFVVVDVGARKGFENHWNQFGDQIKLIGFEPNKDSFDECVQKKSNNQTEYYQYALDNQKGNKDLFITANPSASGFYKPDMVCVRKYGMEASYKILNTTNVKTIDFDTFQNERRLPSIDFMKLDTEGSELDILQGAENSLISEVLGLSIEAEFIRTHIGQPLFADLDQYLRRIGFQLYDLDLNRWSRKVLKSIDNSFGQLHFAQSLYLREAVNEIELVKGNNKLWNDLRILKMASIMELFYLPDCSIELLQIASNQGFLKNNNVNQLIDLLVPDYNGKTFNYKEYLNILSIKKVKKSKHTNSMLKKIFYILPQSIRNILHKIVYHA